MNPEPDTMMGMTVSDSLRRAIRSDGRSVHAIANAAGCSPIQVWRFLKAERGLTTPAVDALSEVLGLELKGKAKRSAGRRPRRRTDD